MVAYQYPIAPMIAYFSEIWPVNLPDDVTKIILQYMITHLNKSMLAEELAEWRAKHVVVVKCYH